MGDHTTWLFCAACAISFAFLATIGPRYEWTRRMLRRMYTNPAFPLILRGGVGILPVLTLASSLLVVALAVPRDLGQWLLLAFLDILGAGLLLTYRTPPPFTPQFLRDEIESGVVRLQRPDGFDRLVFVVLILYGVMVNVLVPLLFLGDL